jgi:hypothetical protein
MPNEDKGYKHIFKVSLDPAQYAADVTGNGSSNWYHPLVNVIMRLHGREKNTNATLGIP